MSNLKALETRRRGGKSRSTDDEKKYLELEN